MALSEHDRIRHREYMRAYYHSSQDRRDKIKERVRRYQEAHPEKMREGRIRRQPALLERRRAQWPLISYGEGLRRRGITIDEYDRQLALQGGGCWFCGSTVPMNRVKAPLRRLLIDHDHKTGRLRGLLCSPCNLSLGMHERGRRSHRLDLDRIKVYLETNQWLAVGSF